jgi:predicted Zn-dependent protease
LSTADPVGSLETALAHTARLLGADAAIAEAQAREILKVAPDHPRAVLLLGAALRRQGRAQAARALLEPLAAQQPNAPAVHLELGGVLADLGEDEAAITAIGRATVLKPDLADAWRALGDALTLVGRTAEADRAYARGIAASVRDPELVAAARALMEGRLAVAEHTLRDVLRARPTDVAAMRMLAEVGARLGRYEDAEAMLAQALELAPGFEAARGNYATVLYRANKPARALEEVERLLAGDPRNASHRALRAAALGQVGEYGAAVEGYAGVLADHPNHPKGWMSYGHVLKTVGRQSDCIAAYRRSLEQAPQLGEAWWSLANLKTVRFSAGDLAAMEGQLARGDLTSEDRFHLHFALGKALEDEGRYEASFAHYAAGNALRREQLDYSADLNTAQIARAKALFRPEFLAARAGQGCDAADPIFIVGLPRAGSTLIEQILSSHSAVEGTMELPDIIALSRRLGGRRGKDEDTAYPEVLAGLGADELAALGREYLDRTRGHRRLGRPMFIDKMPNNFAHVGLIHLILPNAKIIDARRHPLGCCFSAYKQHFARGQAFSYDLTDVGRYYADYVELMAHFDAVLPGRVHRVMYEAMVADPETQVRALLDYCGLPFEAGTLRFYENDRAVRTASSEQVRQPIFADGVDQWRNYERWLDPLKAALGPALAGV